MNKQKSTKRQANTRSTSQPVRMLQAISQLVEASHAWGPIMHVAMTAISSPHSVQRVMPAGDTAHCSFSWPQSRKMASSESQSWSIEPVHSPMPPGQDSQSTSSSANAPE